MKINTKKSIPAEEIDVYKHTICDICKGTFYVPNNNWCEPYALCETSISIAEGYRNGGIDADYYIKSIDVCPSCFKSKVVPLLEKTYNLTFNSERVEY